jgi:hypothetical protein
MKTLRSFEEKHRLIILKLARYAVAFLFVFSAIAKLLPIQIFEHQLLSIARKPGFLFEFTNDCHVFIWSRAIIIFELFLGISFLIPYYIKRFTVPIAISTLIGFIIFLSYQIWLYGNNGNCGCMGGLVPMSPLQAIVKNIITIIVLAYVFYFTISKPIEYAIYHFLILGGVVLAIFLLFPIKKTCCCDEITTKVSVEIENLNYRIDSLSAMISSGKDSGKVSGKDGSRDTVPVKAPLPKITISEFHNFKDFEFNNKKTKINIDEGKTIVCVMNPDCDHCLDITKQLKQMNLAKDIKITFLFCNPDDQDIDHQKQQIKAFMDKSGLIAAFKIISIDEFTKHLSLSPYPPRVVLLFNGKIMYNYFAEGELDKKKIKSL